MPSSDSFRGGLVLVACAALAYIGFWGLEYSADLLGRSPVLDGRENLGWVELIRAGQVPAEPIYRALLYPSLLSVLPVSLGAIPSVAISLGLGFHLLNAFLVGRLAKLVWKSALAVWLSALLYAIYPVALYFSVQVLDVTFATTLFLAASLCLMRPAGRSLPWRLAAGFLIGAAVLARPNFLPVALVMPLIALFYPSTQGKFSWALGFAVLLPMVLLLLGQGLMNAKLSGDFRILPWQGSYNLYAANKSGANGKYFVQQLSFEELPAGVNPTRVESELLYQKSVGPDAALSIDAMSAHWKRELASDVAGNPLRWLGLIGRKVMFLLNDWEQYNNLSYAYHKERFSLLRFNPFGWGLLLLLASFGVAVARKRGDPKSLSAIGIIGLAYAAGVLLFFVSARFRIPLAPLLCVFAGGLVYARQALDVKRAMSFAVPLLMVAAVAYGNWFGARDKSTFIQDQALLAIAASQLAEDAKAYEYAGMVLSQQPDRQDMLRIQVASSFNLWLEAVDSDAKNRYWSQMNLPLGALNDHDAATYFIAGVSAWRSGDELAAVDAWQLGLGEYGNQAETCAAALSAVGKAAPPQSPGFVQQIRELLVSE